MSPTKESWLESLATQAADFRTAVTAEDPAVTLTKPVPSFPNWTVYDLVAKLGAAYQQATGHLMRRGEPGSSDAPKAPKGAAIIEWWDEQLANVTATLAAADPNAPAWNWSHKPHEAGFFHRRLAHETALRRWDAQLSVALPEPIEPPEMAADGVDEVLDTFLPSDKTVAERIEVTGAARFEATDIDAHWVVRVRPNGVALLDTGGWFDDEPDVATIVTGTASDLLLVLWGRVPVSVMSVQGEQRLIEPLVIPA